MTGLRKFALLWHHLELAIGPVKVAAGSRDARTMEHGVVTRTLVLKNSVLVAAGWLAIGAGAAHAEHVCDDAAEEGWRVVPSIEVTDVKDGAPFAAGADWVVERTTTLLPFCNYYSPIGSYNLRSYSLDPFTKGERVVLCHANARGLSEPVAPYAGSCPPK
jgi:hypothetical protein